MVIVAQLVRVLVCGSRGRGFEPRLSPTETLLIEGFFCFILLIFYLAIVHFGKVPNLHYEAQP